MKKNWLKEVARDIIALGSIPFFILVLVRVSLLEKPYFLSQFIIAGVIFLVLMLIFKSDLYSGLALVVLIFTILYYENMRYSIFASLAYLLLLGGLIYLDRDKKKVFKGVLLGAISTAISYYVVKLVF